VSQKKRSQGKKRKVGRVGVNRKIKKALRRKRSA
jgi:hypothetical protein